MNLPMRDTAYPQLAQLLDAYFHQDWSDDHDTEAEVVAAYLQSTWQDEVAQTTAQIEHYLRDHPTGLLAAFEADFAPMISIGASDDEARAWLSGVRNQLQSGLAQAPRRPA